MKKINIPKILSILTLSILLISALCMIIFKDWRVGIIIIYYFGILITPFILLILFVWKLFNKGVKNKYFIFVFLLNLILLLISIYLTIYVIYNSITMI